MNPRLAIAVLLLLAGCSRPHVSPLLPPPYRAEFSTSYERVWGGLIQALAHENTPLRAVAKDSGVIASDDIATPIGVFADCGRFGDRGVEGQALVSFTLFVHPVAGGRTYVQINSKMRTELYGWNSIGGAIKPRSPLICSSTGRWEANLFDANRRLVGE
jgi:hypothetical protein